MNKTNKQTFQKLIYINTKYCFFLFCYGEIYKGKIHNKINKIITKIYIITLI